MEETQIRYLIRKVTEQVINRLFVDGKYLQQPAGVLTFMPCKDIGSEIISLVPSLKKSGTEFSLVTECEVIGAHETGEYTVRCAKGAIVTPLAKDKAKDLGIKIEY